MDILETVIRMKADGITLNDISEELTYRDRTGDSQKWDDNLYDYSTDELEEIEISDAWNS